jgi:HAD superfamily hydrolase (TIGR01509 family)
MASFGRLKTPAGLERHHDAARCAAHVSLLSDTVAGMTLLIFDCDGVLVDSELLANGELADLLTRLGHPMTAEQALARFGGRRLQEVLASAEALLSAPIPPDLGAQAAERLMARFRRELKPVAGVRAAIEALPWARCVASSSPRDRLELSLAVTGLAPLFVEHVFSADQVANGKPAPDLFLLAARTLGAPPADCIVIEDSVLGIRAARAAGMAAIGFAGASHATAKLAERLEQAGADIVIRAMSDLPQAIARHARG